MLKHVDACLSIGTLNKEYYRSLGVPDHKILFAPFCVDNSVFDLGSGRAEARRKARCKLEITPEAKVILFVAKLIARKRPSDLIKALGNLSSKHSDAVLLLVGSGEDEASLRELADCSDVDVRFVGFKNQRELPSLYAASDVFVLPAEGEPWGLVVNEAMAAGLPVIVTDDVGAAPDLVTGKGTGLVYPTGDIASLGQALDDLLSSSERRISLGVNARTQIENWDVKNCAFATVDAVQDVLQWKSR
jgi:glycosyltransferase involved in cell wall biosynthesis